QELLAQRYDLADRPVQGVTMSRGKPVQEGVRVRLPKDMTWEKLAALSPEEIKSKNLWPAGFFPLPHPHHEAGGMLFPQPLIDETKRLFGSQRAMKSVEDFTEFEQRAAYFDGDPVQAQQKGVNILERGSQVHFMAEFQDLLDFPPAPKLNVLGKLDPAKATEGELRG